MKIKIDQRVVRYVSTEIYMYVFIFILLALGYFLLKIDLFGFVNFLAVNLGLVPFWALFGIINILTVFFGYKFIRKKQDKIFFLVLLVIAIIFDFGVVASFVQAMG